MVQLELWGVVGKGVGGECGITRGAAAGSTLGGRAGATLVGWAQGCMGTGEEMV